MIYLRLGRTIVGSANDGARIVGGMMAVGRVMKAGHFESSFLRAEF